MDSDFTRNVYAVHVPNGHRRSDPGLPLETAEALLLRRPAHRQTGSVSREPFVLQPAPVHRKWWEGSRRQSDSGGPVVLTHTHTQGSSAVMYVTTRSFQEVIIHFATFLTKCEPSPRRFTNRAPPLFFLPLMGTSKQTATSFFFQSRLTHFSGGLRRTQ